MMRTGRRSMVAKGTGALGLAALAVTARLAIATDCPPMDLVNYNVTDYIRYSTTSDMLYV